MAVIKSTGISLNGSGGLAERVAANLNVFEEAVGHNLMENTVCFDLSSPVDPKEQFRVLGDTLGTPGDDVLVEVCRVDGIWCYRLSPVAGAPSQNAQGKVAEVVCEYPLPNCDGGSEHTVEFLR